MLLSPSDTDQSPSTVLNKVRLDGLCFKPTLRRADSGYFITLSIGHCPPSATKTPSRRK